MIQYVIRYTKQCLDISTNGVKLKFSIKEMPCAEYSTSRSNIKQHFSLSDSDNYKKKLLSGNFYMYLDSLVMIRYAYFTTPYEDILILNMSSFMTALHTHLHLIFEDNISNSIGISSKSLLNLSKSLLNSYHL